LLAAAIALAGGCSVSNNTFQETVQFDDAKAVAELVDSNPSLIYMRDKDGATPLHWTALWDKPDTAALLLKKGAGINARNKLGKTPLHWAASCGNVAVAQMLIDNGADIGARDERGQTPLHAVFVVGSQFAPSLPIAELLLAKGADIQARDGRGRTPLHWAALLDHRESVRFLLAKGVPMDIFAAAALGDAAQVEHLIRGNSNLACATNSNGTTPLHWASKEGRTDVAALLLSQGADVNARDQDGQTPLHETSSRDQSLVTELLLAHNADVSLENNHGQNAIQSAVAEGHLDRAYLIGLHETEK